MVRLSHGKLALELAEEFGAAAYALGFHLHSRAVQRGDGHGFVTHHWMNSAAITVDPCLVAGAAPSTPVETKLLLEYVL
jgi:hypothetical protein